ncbi:senju [Symbiodinium pilosum]|uniref:Senju protein n=1 Tax=Symbiodinium pilosum TaxID=2952 RepID=A0A812LCM1_SYMPI|nr:senju [Symbiodinium pilosum]
MLGLNTYLKQGIFSTYVALWTSSHLLVYSSRLASAPAYNATSVVLLTETVKLALATAMFLAYDGSVSDMLRVTLKQHRILLKYAIPALLYALYNNLLYINLAAFDPGTYNVLLQLKIALTGVLYQILFSKQLNRNQWRAILLITGGCMCKESGKVTTLGFQANLSSWLLLFVQMLCSVLAGVYNEVLLKGSDSTAGGITTNLQNAFMYFQSILVNGILLMWQGEVSSAISAENVSAICTPRVVLIIGIMSSVGLVTGFFLKHLDSVLKAVASGLEVVFTMLLGFMLFGAPLGVTGVASATLVGSGVALYSRPVPPPPSAEDELKIV